MNIFGTEPPYVAAYAGVSVLVLLLVVSLVICLCVCVRVRRKRRRRRMNVSKAAGSEYAIQSTHTDCEISHIPDDSYSTEKNNNELKPINSNAGFFSVSLRVPDESPTGPTPTSYISTEFQAVVDDDLQGDLHVMSCEKKFYQARDRIGADIMLNPDNWTNLKEVTHGFPESVSDADKEKMITADEDKNISLPPGVTQGMFKDEKLTDGEVKVHEYNILEADNGVSNEHLYDTINQDQPVHSKPLAEDNDSYSTAKTHTLVVPNLDQAKLHLLNGSGPDDCGIVVETDDDMNAIEALQAKVNSLNKFSASGSTKKPVSTQRDGYDDVSLPFPRRTTYSNSLNNSAEKKELFDDPNYEITFLSNKIETPANRFGDSIPMLHPRTRSLMQTAKKQIHHYHDYEPTDNLKKVHAMTQEVLKENEEPFVTVPQDKPPRSRRDPYESTSMFDDPLYSMGLNIQN